MRRIRPTRPARHELPLTRDDVSELAAMARPDWSLPDLLAEYPGWQDRGMREAGQ